MPITISDTDKKVLNFSENFEVAFRQAFIDQGLTYFGITGEDIDESATAGEVLFEPGQATNYGLLPNGSSQLWDAYSGSLVVTLRTPRPNPTPGTITGIIRLHSQICATVRALMQQHRSVFTSSNLPYYTIQHIRPIGTRHYSDYDWLQDVTAMSFQVDWSILNTAWS